MFNPPLHYCLTPSPHIPQQKKLGDPANKAKLHGLTTQAIERLEQLKQKNASLADLDELLDQMPPPPSSEPRGGPSKNSTRGDTNTMRKFIGKLMYITCMHTVIVYFRATDKLFGC